MELNNTQSPAGLDVIFKEKQMKDCVGWRPSKVTGQVNGASPESAVYTGQANDKGPGAVTSGESSGAANVESGAHSGRDDKK